MMIPKKKDNEGLSSVTEEPTPTVSSMLEEIKEND
jgi:hypothetical protein